MPEELTMTPLLAIRKPTKTTAKSRNSSGRRSAEEEYVKELIQQNLQRSLCSATER
jgi:hypothetical protein